MTRERMENVGVGLETSAIRSLQFAKLVRLRVMRIDRKAFINEEVPNFLASLPGVKRFVLRVRDVAKFLVRSWRLGAITLPDQLHYTFALINLLAQ